MTQIGQRILIVFCAIIWSIPFGFGKTYSYRHYTVADGLPSSELHSAIQDDDGFIWFATDRGLVRFDGYVFETYTTKDGLVDNVLLDLVKDHKGRIWMTSYSGELAYVDQSGIHAYPYNHVINSITHSPLTYSLFVDSLDNVHMGFLSSGYLQIHADGSYERDTSTTYLYNIRSFDKGVVHYKKRNKFSKDSCAFIKFHSEKKSSAHKVPFTHFFPDEHSHIRTATRDCETGMIYFSVNKILFSIDKKNRIKRIYEARNRIISISSFKGKVWVGLYKGGFDQLNTVDNNTITFSGLQEYSISDFMYDREGLVWVSTLEDGVFCILNMHHYSLTTEDGLTSNYVYTICGKGDKVMFMDDYGLLNRVSKKEDKVFEYINDISLPHIPLKIVYSPADSCHMLLYSTKTLCLKPNKKHLLFEVGLNDILPDPRGTYRYVRTSNHNLWYTSVDSNQKISRQIHSNAKYSSHNVECIQFSNDSSLILIGMTNGVYYIDPKEEKLKIKSYFDNDSLYNFRIVDLEDYPNMDFIAATRSVGLLISKNKKAYTLKEEDGLISDQITSLFVDESNIIWVGSSNGISIISPTREILNLTVADGLISNEVTDIYANSNYAYIGTKKGLTILDRSKIKGQNKDISIYFKGSELENGEVQLNHNEPLLSVNFVGLHFKSLRNLQYRYRLNANQEWQYTDNTNLVFNNLNSGNHSLEIQASIDKQNWSTDPATLEIYVTFPFWQRLPFKVSVVFIFAALLIMGYKLMLGRIKNREKTKRQIQKLRYTALGAQMNPHFIFNSLNSIQNFTIRNEKKESIKYLSKFAKLMRKTLDHSVEKNISLKEEISALKLYLELEALRFDNSIRYEIILDSTIPTDKVMIPALLIQPLVENAILHGLRPKQDGGLISITCKRKEAFLLLVIEDNGIGRFPHKMEKTKEMHQSKGNSLTKERIKLFAQEYNASYGYKIEDLTDENGPCGTKVTIKIPYIIKIEGWN